LSINTAFPIMHLSSSIFLIAAVPHLVSAKPTAERCSPLELVIARGTYEPGRYGLIVGDPLVAAVARVAPQVTAFNIAYPANADKDSSDKGTEMTISHITSQAAACPAQRFVLVGYSQGASVMHRTSGKLPAELQSKIAGAVTFGDPGQRATATTGRTPKFPSSYKVHFNCAEGDPTCSAGNEISKHLTYNSGSYMSESAKFIKNLL